MFTGGEPFFNWKYLVKSLPNEGFFVQLGNKWDCSFSKVYSKLDGCHRKQAKLFLPVPTR